MALLRDGQWCGIWSPRKQKSGFGWLIANELQRISIDQIWLEDQCFDKWRRWAESVIMGNLAHIIVREHRSILPMSAWIVVMPSRHGSFHALPKASWPLFHPLWRGWTSLEALFGLSFDCYRPFFGFLLSSICSLLFFSDIGGQLSFLSSNYPPSIASQALYDYYFQKTLWKYIFIFL